MNKIFTIICTALLLAGLSRCAKFDDSDLWNSVSNLEEKVAALENRIHQMNQEMNVLQTLVNALHEGKVITGVATDAAGSTFTFSDGTTLPVLHGTNGNDGAPGAAAPVIGVGADGGVYYWTITIDGETTWLTGAQGERLPVTGAAGVDGVDGTTPVIGVDDEGYWTVDGRRITGADGNPIKASGDGGSFFSDVSDGETAVTFTLANGTVLVIPKAASVSVTLAGGNVLYLQYGATKEYAITLTGVESLSIAKPDGWKASVRDGRLSLTAPPMANTYAEKDGTVSIVAVGRNATVIKNLTVSARDYNYVIDFEDPRVADYLAGPTSYGDNLYSSYAGADRYVGYDDAGSGLLMMVNESYGSHDFWNGGIAISQWNDMATEGYLNQCSVYYRDPVTGRGGCDGSATFAVGFGYNDPFYLGDSRSRLTFGDGATEAVFDHFYVTNSTYAALAMTNGYFVARPFSYATHDWFRLIIEGFRANGASTGTVEVYLADFRTPASPGLLTEWMPVDLSPLGAVETLTFDFQSSDTGDYGMNTPGYFCFDNLALKQ
jgi:outer membrane murein-binding lipoprotein Lpp